MDGQATEFVTSELKKLVGWGCHPRRVAVMPTLRRLAGVEDGTCLVTAGYIVRGFIEQAIQNIQPTDFEGKVRDSHELKRVFRLLLQFEGTSQSAENRRYRVISILGLCTTVDQFRRPYGLERDLMRILAKAVTDPQT